MNQHPQGYVLKYRHQYAFTVKDTPTAVPGHPFGKRTLKKFAKWKVHDNPFDRKDYSIVEKWGYVKANTFRGIILAKKWSYKKDIITALNSVPTQPINNN